MSSLEPLINLIALLTVLSVAAKPLSNVFKLEEQDLREKREDEPVPNYVEEPSKESR